MRLSLHPKPRPSLRLVVQLSAGLLVPLWGAPALAQGVAVITPSPAMAPREEREKLAPLVMAPAAAEAMRAEEAANQLAWRESLKRMKADETDEPNRALAAYKRFFNERTMSPELGVEVGVKIAQLRFKLGDSKDALQTCEVLAAKYADEPTAVLLSLQKARVLMESKQLAQASQCVNGVMPSLVALGPSRYREISDLLLKLVQANLDNGDAEGKERAKVLCVGVEEIYLRWTKKDAVDHLWQRFEALQIDYQRAGDDKRAEELLPKVGDALLQMPVERGYIEGAVLFLEAGRWSVKQGRNKQASDFYSHVPKFAHDWHTGLAVYDQARTMIQGGKYDEARSTLLKSAKELTSDPISVALLSILSVSYLKTGDLQNAEIYSRSALSQSSVLTADFKQRLKPEIESAQQNMALIEAWKRSPIICRPRSIEFNSSENGILSQSLILTSYKSGVWSATTDCKEIDVYLKKDEWSTDDPTDKSQKVTVRLRSSNSSINTTLEIRNSAFPNVDVIVPIHFEAQM